VYLQNLGAAVELTADPNLAAFKAEHGVPPAASACHTALLEDYVIEGHVPAGAILRLLEDRPDAVGLALPGMPLDSAGMAGNPATWESQPVALITTGGALVPFDY
jgi:hypothetical protein